MILRLYIPVSRCEGVIYSLWGKCSSHFSVSCGIGITKKLFGEIFVWYPSLSASLETMLCLCGYVFVILCWFVLTIAKLWDIYLFSCQTTHYEQHLRGWFTFVGAPGKYQTDRKFKPFYTMQLDKVKMLIS